MTIRNEGVCPYCGSDDVQYCDGEVGGGGYCYEAWCNRCDKAFEEWYDLVYSETIKK